MSDQTLVQWSESTIDGRTTSSVAFRAATGDIVGALVEPAGAAFAVTVSAGGIVLEGMDFYPTLAIAQAKGDAAVLAMVALAKGLVDAGKSTADFRDAVSRAAKAALARREEYQKHLDRNPGAPPNPAGGIDFSPGG